jgi:hypothetical protein
MKKRIITIFFILFVFATAIFILNYRSTNPLKEKEKLFILADSLNVKQGQMRSNLNILTQLVKSLYLSREYSFEGTIPQNYHVDTENLYKTSNDGLAMVFYTGEKPIGDDLIRDVVMLEQLDDFLQRVYLSDKCIESIFYYDNSSFYRYYPYLDYNSKFRNIDFQKTPQFAFIMQNITRNGIIWINKPYQSLFSGKWIISVARPVLEGNNLLGICMINIDLSRLNDYLDNIDSNIGVLNPDGIILHPDLMMRDETTMPPWITHDTLSDSLTVLDFSLLNSNQSSFRQLGDRIVKQKDYFYSQRIYNTDFVIVTNEMTSMNVYLYTMVYDDGSVAKMKRLRRRINKSRERRIKEEME